MVNKLEINRNPFIGLYLSASDGALLVSPHVPEKLLDAIKETLKPSLTCFTTIGDSHLTGLFAVLNSNGIVVPRLAEEKEVKKLKAELGVNVYKIEDRFSAVRNNLLVNDRACVVNPHIPNAEQLHLRDCLGVEVIPHKIGNVPTVGSVNVVTNKGLLAYNNVDDAELDWLCKTFKVTGVPGTCNFGTISTSLGIVANSQGCLAGSLSTGFELGTIYQALNGE